MTQWYAVIDGTQYGPVDEATFRQWITEGRVQGHHLVWREGLAEWVPAMSLDGLFPEGASPSGATVSTKPKNSLIAGQGTGHYGQSPNATIAASARSALKGKVFFATGFMFLAWIIPMAISSLRELLPAPEKELNLLAMLLGLALSVLSLAITAPFELSKKIFFVS
jgi:hypothetical protein